MIRAYHAQRIYLMLSSNKIAVIGLGNTLRKDDGIGLIILELLKKSRQKDNIDYLNYGTASIDLVHKISDYNKVLLIDGINAKLSPGDLKIFELNEIDYNVKEDPISTHEINLTGLFELCKKINIKTKIYVAGIQVEDTSYKEGLSALLSEKKEKYTKEISSFIDKNLK